MKFSLLVLAGLSAMVSAQTTAIPNATQMAASMASAASAAAKSAQDSALSNISAQRASQTLVGEAASQAAVNSQAQLSALSQISALQGTIASAEASVLSVQKTAIASLSKQVATATGKYRALAEFGWKAANIVFRRGSNISVRPTC